MAAWLSKIFLPETESPQGREISRRSLPPGVGLRPEAKAEKTVEHEQENTWTAIW